MKELICASQIEEILEKGEKKVYITSKTILTPSAKDIIANNNMEIVLKEKEKFADTKREFKDIDMEKVVDFFKLLAKEDTYRDLIMSLLAKKNFDQEKDLSGFTLIKGKNMTFNHIKDENINISYQEVLKEKEKRVTILEIENSNFSKKIDSEEVIYITDGKVSFEIDKRTYEGKEGDIIYIPSTVKTINFHIEERAKFFSISEKISWIRENLILEGK